MAWLLWLRSLYLCGGYIASALPPASPSHARARAACTPRRHPFLSLHPVRTPCLGISAAPSTFPSTFLERMNPLYHYRRYSLSRISPIISPLLSTLVYSNPLQIRNHPPYKSETTPWCPVQLRVDRGSIREIQAVEELRYDQVREGRGEERRREIPTLCVVCGMWYVVCGVWCVVC